MTVKIYCNYHKRELLYFWELSDKLQAEARETYNYTDIEELEYFVYHGSLYSMIDFMSLHNTFYCPNPPEFMHGWAGYTNDSFFSGVLVKWALDDCGDMDTEHVIVGTFIG